MKLYVHNEVSLKAKARRLSIAEGGMSAGQSGFGDYFFVPFILKISPQYGAVLTGAISGLQNLFAPLSEIYGNKLMGHRSRKSIVRRFSFFQAISLLTLIAVALLFWFDVLTGFLPLFLILSISLYYILGAILYPAWFSWMGDIVSEKERGRYFAYRNKVAGIIAIIASFIGAYLLDYFDSKKIIMAGFIVLFGLALVFRFISYRTFAKKSFYEPQLKFKNGYYFSFFQFVKKMPFTNFGKFVIFIALLNGAVAVASPFVNVFMLDELKFDYKIFTLINLTASIATLLFLPLWGKFTDKKGNRKMMILGSIFIPLIPILWIFSRSPYYLVVPSVVGGIVWGGFNLAATNFIYDSVRKEHRGLCVAYYAIVVGIAIFVGSLFGGLVLNYVPITFMDKYYFLFLVSGVLRAVAALIMLPLIKETRRISEEIPVFSLHFHHSMAGMGRYHMHWENSLHEFEKKVERTFE
jgi:MFS family permease